MVEQQEDDVGRIEQGWPPPDGRTLVLVFDVEFMNCLPLRLDSRLWSARDRCGRVGGRACSLACRLGLMDAA